MKMLKFLAAAMLFTIAGISFNLEAKPKKPKKSCDGRIKSDCNSGCEWRHDKCRKKDDDKGSDSTKLDFQEPALGANSMQQTITNNSGVAGVGNALEVSFYDNNRNTIGNPMMLWFGNANSNGSYTGGEWTGIPANAAFITVANTPLSFVSVQPNTSYAITYLNNTYGLVQDTINTSGPQAPNRLLESTQADLGNLNDESTSPLIKQEPTKLLAQAYTGFYNVAGQTMVVQPLADGQPYGASYSIDYVPGATWQHGSQSNFYKVPVNESAGSKLSFMITIPNHASTVVEYDPTCNYQITADATTIFANKRN